MRWKSRGLLYLLNKMCIHCIHCIQSVVNWLNTDPSLVQFKHRMWRGDTFEFFTNSLFTKCQNYSQSSRSKYSVLSHPNSPGQSIRSKQVLGWLLLLTSHFSLSMNYIKIVKVLVASDLIHSDSSRRERELTVTFRRCPTVPVYWDDDAGGGGGCWPAGQSGRKLRK